MTAAPRPAYDDEPVDPEVAARRRRKLRATLAADPLAPSRAHGAGPGDGPVAPSRGNGRRGVVPPDERVRLRATFGQAVWRERAAVGLTQVSLARAAGLSPTTIGEFEAGRLRPSASSILKIAKAVRLTFDDAEVAAVAVRLETAAGESLRVFGKPMSARWVKARAVARERANVAAERARELRASREAAGAAALAAAVRDVGFDPFDIDVAVRLAAGDLYPDRRPPVRTRGRQR